jgi:mevalonate kinase
MEQQGFTKRFSANGKFLITGEYAVLDNVSALAVPLKLQQHIEINALVSDDVVWKSYDGDGSLWFELNTDISALFGIHDYRDPVANKLAQILRKAKKLQSQFKINHGFEVSTRLDFNRKYGMGTSSTLISLISQWSGCDPYALQFSCFGGSGYDIACATAQQALTYNYNNADPVTSRVTFNPAIHKQLFFVYLNQKQNSRDSIARFDKTLLTAKKRAILDQMPQQFMEHSNNVQNFNKVVGEHEMMISELIGLEPVKQRLFSDFTGAVKSLGGWGGDFILATGGSNERDYFKNRGYGVVLEWENVVLG